MSASSSAPELQFSASAQSTADYSKIEEADRPFLEKWLKLKERINAINALPRAKTAERRRQAEQVLGEAATQFGGFISKYDFLLREYFQLTQVLNQYINAQIKPLEEASKAYFQNQLHQNQQEIIEEPKFFSKKGGDQLGRQMRIEYFDKTSKEKRTIDYFIKTHQGGAKSGQSSARPVDPKELFVYKVLEYTGLGPEVHFFFNHLSQGGFYIATQDCGFSKSIENQKNKSFMTLEALKEKRKEDPKTINELIHQMNNVIHGGFACADILSRLFCLRDVLTNSGNSGFVLNKDKFKFKVVDFSVIDTQGSYSSDSIFAGYLSGNGMFNYIDDEFLKKYLKDVSEPEKIKLAQEVQENLFSKTSKHLSLHEAIDKAAEEVFKFVNQNYLNLGISPIPLDPSHDFNRYVKDIKSNYGKFSQDLNENVLRLTANTQGQITDVQSSSSSAGSSQLLQYQHVLQQQQQQQHESLSSSAKVENKPGSQ
jgi:hypothetical protein